MSTAYICQINDSALKYAEETLGETSEKRDKCVQEIKEWLEENPYLNARTDYNSILIFLRGCKFNTEKTKVKLKNYYEMKGSTPEWFQDRNPLLPNLKELFELGVFIPLRRPDPEGRMVVIIRTAAHNPKRHKQNDVFKVGKMILDLAVKQNEYCSVYGVLAIFDMAGVTLGHARQLPPNVIKKVVHAWQNYHCRPKSLNFINAPIHVNFVLNIFRQFMTEKMKNRISIHYGGNSSLHKLVPKEQLPQEYGGDDGNLNSLIEYWKQIAIEHTDWFKTDEQHKAKLN